MMEDRAIGVLLLSVGSVLMLYYLVWMVAMPFVDGEHFLQFVFPPTEYGLVIPSLLGGAVLSVLVVVGSIHSIVHRTAD